MAASERARQLRGGALLCLGYAALFLVLHAPRLDELIVPAQIIAGTVAYPDGHPHLLFYTGVYSLLDYLVAGLWILVPDARVVGALLNVLFVFLSAFVPYAVAVVLTGRIEWGFAASALVLLSAAVRFQGTYPMYVFPSYFTNGHAGAHLGLLTVALLLGRQWRAGALLLGVLPAVHASIAALVWGWTALHFLLLRAGPARGERRGFGVSFGAGILVCLGLAGLIAWRTAGLGPAPPYAGGADAEAVYRGFAAATDMHRRAFPPVSLGYLVNPVLFFALGVLALLQVRDTDPAELPAPRRAQIAGLLLLGGMLWAGVFGVRTMQALSIEIPRALNVLMVNRYSNLSAMLIAPLAVTAIAIEVDRHAEQRLSVLLVLIVALFAGTAGSLQVLNSDLVMRNLMLAIAALAFAGAVASGERVRRTAAACGALAVVLALLPFFPLTRVALYFATMFLGATGLLIWLGRVPVSHLRWDGARGLLLAGVAVAGAAALVNASEHGDDLVLGASEEHLRAAVAQEAGPSDMVLAAAPVWRVQIVARRPVLMEWHTLYLMTYGPEYAGVIGAMTRDLYGVDYAAAEPLVESCGGRLIVFCQLWLTEWTGRPRAVWQQLAGKYGFRLVVTPGDTELDLPAIDRGDGWVLYEIPSS